VADLAHRERVERRVQCSGDLRGDLDTASGEAYDGNALVDRIEGIRERACEQPPCLSAVPEATRVVPLHGQTPPPR
jgi:hypothetical protein